MKTGLMMTMLSLLAMTMQAQTAKTFTLDLTDDGKAQMVCFLPEKPSGKAIVGVPGGGYSVLSNTHEGTLAADWMNKQGIAYSKAPDGALYYLRMRYVHDKDTLQNTFYLNQELTEVVAFK